MSQSLVSQTWTTAALGLIAIAALAQAPPRITIDQLVAIKHPAAAQWTPDGSHVWFTWDEGGRNDTYVVASNGATPPVALTAGGHAATGGFWSRDGGTFYFSRNGGLQAEPASGGEAAPAWPSAARGSSFTSAPDGTRVAFVADGQLLVHALASGTDQAIAHAPGSVSALTWSPDGARLAYVLGTGNAGRGRRGGGGAAATAATAPAGSDLFVADLSTGASTHLVHEADAISGAAWSPDGASLSFRAGAAGTRIAHNVSPPEIGAKLIFVITENDRGAGQSLVVPSVGGAPVPVDAGGGFGRGGSGWLDATHLLSTRTSDDGKTRTSEAVDIQGGAPVLLHRDTEDKFFSQVNATTALSPDRRWLMYTSDATGWDQVYVVSTRGGASIQISRTPGDHWRAAWSHDSRRLAWDTNTAERPGDRQIEIATLGDNPAHATIVALTSGNGVNTDPAWSPDDRRILYQHTDAQSSADLYVADAAAGARPLRLTHSMPAALAHTDFVAPQLVHYPGPDGKPVPAWLFVPHNLDRSRLHAAIVWVHPDGVNMNYDGWHPDRNEAVYYEFHQYLLQEGYIVIAPDYRGSIGYGRDWRNDVYMDVGGKDAKDARLAATYLKTLGSVDPARIGIWGLSYGGFFVLQAVTQEPTWFRAAVDVAGVTDYHLYYEDPYHGGWTTSRIGTPDEHPDVYAKADPMAHVDQLQTPLLVLAGTADVNVPFVESALLVDALLKAGKGGLVNFMMYPGEFHYFDRDFVVRDAWQRADDFFAAHLHPDYPPAPRPATP